MSYNAYGKKYPQKLCKFDAQKIAFKQEKEEDLLAIQQAAKQENEIKHRGDKNTTKVTTVIAGVAGDSSDRSSDIKDTLRFSCTESAFVGMPENNMYYV